MFLGQGAIHRPGPLLPTLWFLQGGGQISSQPGDFPVTLTRVQMQQRGQVGRDHTQRTLWRHVRTTFNG
ncbi:hypothetical protein DFI_20005 (plasmid) [Deinococcus ficus]|uniref:Uncharacterized protein n=1 Tax=Deinococcus ficus TaxID=317577 RepID=A0A221T3P7_9DEIO|nr:hypothetical protein DFI_20005 [Deinococcus ficus]